jgi:hypothetical protein
MRVAIHQPNFMPWSGFFRKMALCDTFVILDDVQYEKNGYTNRVKIRTNKGLEWVTVPVHAHITDRVKDVKIDYSGKKYFSGMDKIKENYVDAKNFFKIWPAILNTYYSKPDYLYSLNMKFIALFKEILKIPADIIMSSDLDIKTKGSDKILDICRLLNGDIYVSGPSGKDYLKQEDFINNEIDIVWMPPGQHKPYKQILEPFISGASELDYIMNAVEI